MDARSADLQGYVRDALRLIRGAVEQYHAGVYPSYRLVAAQLRLLLCDTNRVHNRLTDVSLLPRARPRVRLHPLLAGRLELDRQAEKLSLKEWLSQPVPAYPALTLRELIRAVSELDGGAHVDLKPESPLWGFEGRAEAVVKVGEIILEELES